MINRYTPAFSKLPKWITVMERMHPKQKSYQCEDYLKFIREHACLVCQNQESVAHHGWHANKNDYLAIPLCVDHHTAGGDSVHRMGGLSFEVKHNISFSFEIINLLSEYLDSFSDEGEVYRGFH